MGMPHNGCLPTGPFGDLTERLVLEMVIKPTCTVYSSMSMLLPAFRGESRWARMQVMFAD